MKDENLEEQVVSEKKKRPLWKVLAEILTYVVIFLFCIFIVPHYILQRTVVSGDSMQNTLHNSESLLIEKVSKHFTDPKRYDIIVFDPPASLKEDDSYYVKRVIGLPGETIQIKGNDIFINGKKIEEHYGKDPMDDMDNETASKPLKLGSDQFFVLGDNRCDSTDSRFESLGPIHRSQIAGRCILRIWPLSSFGVPK